MSPQQNKALHLFFRWIAEALREDGVDMGEIRLSIPIRPTEGNVKELLWRPLMQAHYPEYTSTREVATNEIDDVVDVMTQALGELFSIYVPFPTEDDVKRETLH